MEKSRKRVWLQTLHVVLFAAMSLIRCAGDAGTGATAQPGSLNGTIRESEGAYPADSVLVKIFYAGSFEVRPAAIAVTDELGHFNVEGLDDGYYSLYAETGKTVLFHDSLLITTDRSVTINDTLECSGMLTGRIIMQQGDDPRTVTIHLAGTGKRQNIDNPEGTFTIAGLANGAYTLQRASTLPDYLPTSSIARITRCSTSVPVDSFGLTFTGMTPVEDIRITQDTAAGIIRISWKKCPYPDLRDYLLFRDTSTSGTPPFVPFAATRDTVAVDTVFRSLKPDPADTAIRRCRYRIAVRDNNGRTGPTPRTAIFAFLPKSSVTTFFTRRLLNKTEEQQLWKRGDTLFIALSAGNRTRTLHRLEWYDAANRDTLAVDSSPLPSVRELTGSIRFVFRTTAEDTLLAIVSDKAGNRWVDTILLAAINDIPNVTAGRDTGVFFGERVCFHGRATQRTGFITKWEWKTGSGTWTPAGPDLCLSAPVSESILVCSLAVTDDFGNRGTDAVSIFSTAKVRSMKAGSEVSLILKEDGTLWGCGQNNEFALNDSLGYDIINPVQMLTNVEHMEHGFGFTLMLQSDGILWGRGNNSYGQLGNATTTIFRSATMVMTDVAGIAAAGGHSFFVKKDGSLWACGSNEYGQLGNGTRTGQNHPVEIMKDVRKVSTSSSHTLILKTDGSLWACGLNESGQLGDGTRKGQRTPVPVMSGVHDISAGSQFSMILKTDSTLWTCGNNQGGSLGNGTSTGQQSPVKVLEHIVRISAGQYHALALTASDSAWGFGSGGGGQLGPWGAQTTLSPVPIADGVSEISAGNAHSLFLKRDGTLWGCGFSSAGQLGTRSSTAIRELLRVVPPEMP